MSVVVLIGAIVIALAFVFFVVNLVTAYRTEGGSIGQVPVMAFPVALPLQALIGIGLIDSATGWPGLPVWGYVILWLTATLGARQATVYAGNLGTRKAAARNPGQAAPQPTPIHFKDLLDAEILDTVKSALGRRLTAVFYGVLAGDLPHFDPWSPNETGGCQSVVLEFEGVAFALTWNENAGWDSRFGDPESHFSLMARRGTGNAELSVGHVPPWSKCVNQQLQGFELLTPTKGPQALRLIFPATTVIVATGYTGHDPLIVGDGDELLIFTDEDWPKPDWRVLDPSKLET